MKKIIVIDDEKHICDSIARLVLAQGYACKAFCDQSPALEYLLTDGQADLILLDVWMPELDGYAFLKKLQTNNIAAPVVVMSGHANVAMSAQTLKSGAADFLEKPFSSELLLAKLQRILKQEPGITPTHSEQYYNSACFVQTTLPQRTIKKNIVLKGIGLHSGDHTGLILMPLPPDSGVIFEDIATSMTLRALPEYVHSAHYATTLQNSEVKVSVTEHLLATLHIYGIDNIQVKVAQEVPILDGSALPFCQAVEEAGILEQPAMKREFVVAEPYVIQDADDATKKITLTPYNGFKISYELDLPKEYGRQYHEVDLTGDVRIARFKQEIAPCRTFGFLDETRHLQSSGMALGANLENALLLHKNRVVNSELRFPNEFARHKIIDILGDLYLLGTSIRGQITAYATGHRHNVALVKQIVSKLTQAAATT